MPLIDILIPNASSDLIGVFDSDFNQVFSTARPLKVSVKESSKVMEHPVEDGTTITDHVVILPIEIELSMLALSKGDYRSTYQEIRQYWKNSTLLSVQTKTATYENLIISEMPHEEDSSMFDAIPIAVKMREVVFVSPKYGTLPERKVANKKQASTVKAGEKQTETPANETEKKGSLASKIWGAAQ